MDLDLKLTAVKTSLLLLKLCKNDLADKEAWALMVTNTLKKFWEEVIYEP